MVTFQTLRDVKPSQFEAAADGYHAVSTAASTNKDRIADQLLARTFPASSPEGGGEGLSGAGAEAARKRLMRLGKNFHYAQIECGLISAALNAFAAELRAAKRKLTEAVEEATSAGFTVKEDGSVHWTSEKEPLTAMRGVTAQDSTGPLADPDPKRVKAQGYADRIGDALADAAEADQKWGPKLERLKAQNDLTISDKDWANVQGDQSAVRKAAGDYLDGIKDPPKNGTPAENAMWWKKLSADEKADYVALRPAAVGALDGLPATVRDEANRTVLVEKQGSYRTELAAMPKEPNWYQGASGGKNQKWRDWNEKYGERKKFLERSLKGMDAIQNRFDRTGQNGLPEAYLLGFDTKGAGDGRVILANGNPDKADHTAVYVPGTSSNLETIGGSDPGGPGKGDLGRGDALWTESHRAAPGKEISTITWLDYDAPRSATPIMDGDLVPEATNPSYAQKAAPTLTEFTRGMEAAQDNTGKTHTTLIGHSYGSTAIGEAAKQGGLAADDIVVAGSPGMQVERANQLGVEADHVWAMAAPFSKDQVPSAGRLVGLGADGVVPTDSEFGGNIMKTDSPDHGGYWNENSTSLRNQARVVTGHYDEVDHE